MDGSRGGESEAWRQRQQQEQEQQQRQTQSTTTSSFSGGGIVSQGQKVNMNPTPSWQQQQQQQQYSLAPQTQEQQQQMQQHYPQRVYDYTTAMPLPMQSYPNPPHLQSPSLASPSQSQYFPYYSQQQQQQQQQQQRFTAPYAAAYAPQQARQQQQPMSMPNAAGLAPTTWYNPPDLYSDQLAISPHQENSSRHVPSAKETPLSRVPSGSGSSSMQIPFDDTTRWSSYPNSGIGVDQRVYPSGMVGGPRGSFSTVSSSSGSNISRSPTQPISTTPTHYQQQPYPSPSGSGSGSGSVPSGFRYPELSATSMIMPPPNPPPEIRMPTEPEMQRRAATACNFCRARKLRCDGSAPCRQCARRDLECVFSQTNLAKRRRRHNDDDEEGDAGARKTSIGESRVDNLHDRRGSSSNEANTSASTKRSDRQGDDTEPRRRKSKVGVEIEQHSAKAFNSLPLLPNTISSGETCRSYLPLYTLAPWPQQGRTFA